jgi:hypothetical protein
MVVILSEQPARTMPGLKVALEGIVKFAVLLSVSASEIGHDLAGNLFQRSDCIGNPGFNDSAWHSINNA